MWFCEDVFRSPLTSCDSESKVMEDVFEPEERPCKEGVLGGVASTKADLGGVVKADL